MKHTVFWKLIFLQLILLLINPAMANMWVESTARFKSPTQISVGVSHICTLDDEGVRCSGDLTRVPLLNNPYKIGSGKGFSCALDENGATCWNNKEQKKIPGLKNPRQLSVYENAACLLDSDGLKCWSMDLGKLGAVFRVDERYFEGTVFKNPVEINGPCILDDSGWRCLSNETGNLHIPASENIVKLSPGSNFACFLKNESAQCTQLTYPSEKRSEVVLNKPTQVSSGHNHACALDADGVKCWGSGFAPWNEFVHISSLKNPTHIDTRGYKTCAIDDEGVKCWTSNEPKKGINLEKVRDVSAGYATVCAIDDRAAECWGDLNTYETLKNPRQISSSSYTACALDDRGLACWGELVSKGVVPSRIGVKARKVSVSLKSVCVLMDEGVNCWGPINSYPKPSLQTPSSLSISNESACVLDEEKVKCWGAIDKYPQPQFKNPRQVQVQLSFGNNSACALDDHGVTCWGGDIPEKVMIPSLKNPVQLSDSCALDSEGVKCWTLEGKLKAQKQPFLFRPVRVSSNSSSATCALDEDRWKCWGNVYLGRSGKRINFDEVVPTLGKSTMRTFLIDKVYENLPPVRANYLKVLMDFMAKNQWNQLLEKSESYLFSALISPVVLSTDSLIFREKLIPEFSKYLKSSGENFGYSDRDDGFRKTPDSKLSRQIALTSLRSALLMISKSFTPAERDRVQSCIRKIGLLIANPMNDQKVKTLLDEVETISLQKISASQKSAFLIDVMDLAKEWLNNQVVKK